MKKLLGAFLFYLVSLQLHANTPIDTAIQQLMDDDLKQCISDIAAEENYSYAEEILFLSCSRISDLTGIDTFTGLEGLVLAFSDVSEFQSLISLSNLRRLDLANAPSGSPFVIDALKLSGLTNITSLNIYDGTNLMELSNTSSLVNLKQIKTLRLANVKLDNLGFLLSLTNLETLDLQSNQIVDINPLGYLTNLKNLSLRNNPISDLSSLSSLTSIESLDLSLVGANNLSSLSLLKSLESLFFKNNKIRDISVIKNFQHLVILGLSDNSIYRVENSTIDFINSTEIRALDFRGNPLHCDDKDKLEEGLSGDILLVFGDYCVDENSLADADGDGLTDYEELELYDTDWINPDTDGDSFNDGEDAFPLDASEWEDFNNNGIGDNQERAEHNSSGGSTSLFLIGVLFLYFFRVSINSSSKVMVEEY